MSNNTIKGQFYVCRECGEPQLAPAPIILDRDRRVYFGAPDGPLGYLNFTESVGFSTLQRDLQAAGARFRADVVERMLIALADLASDKGRFTVGPPQCRNCLGRDLEIDARRAAPTLSVRIEAIEHHGYLSLSDDKRLSLIRRMREADTIENGLRELRAPDVDHWRAPAIRLAEFMDNEPTVDNDAGGFHGLPERSGSGDVIEVNAPGHVLDRADVPMTRKEPEPATPRVEVRVVSQTNNSDYSASPSNRPAAIRKPSRSSNTEKPGHTDVQPIRRDTQSRPSQPAARPKATQRPAGSSNHSASRRRPPEATAKNISKRVRRTERRKGGSGFMKVATVAALVAGFGAVGHYQKLFQKADAANTPAPRPPAKTAQSSEPPRLILPHLQNGAVLLTGTASPSMARAIQSGPKAGLVFRNLVVPRSVLPAMEQAVASRGQSVILSGACSRDCLLASLPSNSRLMASDADLSLPPIGARTRDLMTRDGVNKTLLEALSSGSPGSNGQFKIGPKLAYQSHLITGFSLHGHEVSWKIFSGHQVRKLVGELGARSWDRTLQADAPKLASKLTAIIRNSVDAGDPADESLGKAVSVALGAARSASRMATVPVVIDGLASEQAALSALQSHPLECRAYLALPRNTRAGALAHLPPSVGQGLNRELSELLSSQSVHTPSHHGTLLSGFRSGLVKKFGSRAVHAYDTPATRQTMPAAKACAIGTSIINQLNDLPPAMRARLWRELPLMESQS